MDTQAIQVTEWPELKAPLLIAGFDGWGNALNISKGMVLYLTRKFEARPFAKINPDLFYNYGANRPQVNIEAGNLKQLTAPGGSFYAARTGSGARDLVLLEADEPSLMWFRFTDELLGLCKQLKVDTIITLGSMYDNVVHTDRIVSGLASNPDVFSELKQINVAPVSYQGPSAIHSTIQSIGSRQGFQCLSLWCHCPYYLQNTTHYGLLAHLGALLSSLGRFTLYTKDLEDKWTALETQIEDLIEESLELQSVIKELRQTKVRGNWESLKEAVKGDKVINLKDFLPPS